jgi:MFS family permease
MEENQRCEPGGQAGLDINGNSFGLLTASRTAPRIHRFDEPDEQDVSVLDPGARAAAQIAFDKRTEFTHPARTPYAACLLLGLGGLFAGVTGPLLSAFVPPLVQGALGDHRTAIGAVMAIDNVLLLLLVPLAGAASDRASARGRGRLPFVLGGFVLASAGMALFPWSAMFGITGVIAALVVLYTGINVQRSPVHALVADLVPSRYRSLATGSVTFQMCAGAIVFLMLGRMLGMQAAFLIASVTVLGIAAAFALGLREPHASKSQAAEATFHSLLDAVWSAARGRVPGLRAVFVASVLLQLTFQTFTTWFALHGIERFGIRSEDATVGFIAWAIGGVIGALPAGAIGVRVGRRNAMLLGFALMAACLLSLDRITHVSQATPLLALASASWTLPMVNAYPLFVEPIPRQRRGVLAAMFLLSMALGGAIGDPLNGRVFDLVDGYRPMFLMMAGYTALAFVAVIFVPRGSGEADTGPASARP